MNYGAFESRSVAQLASLVGVVAALCIGGCGGDDDDGGDSMAGTVDPMTGDGESESDGMDDGDSGSSDGTDDGSAPLSHATDIQPIWDQYCVPACHEPGGEWEFNNLSGDAYNVIVDMPSTQNTLMNYITSGDPDASYLLHKMRGTQVTSGGSGLTMPKGIGTEPAVVVPAADIDKVEAWINQGTPE
ncbi:MAG: hypothetical protein JKY37_02565 [Nannocystaceae bacterium]|nr:hypothetical protein [Nannocystaceae bacterium]